MENPFIELAEHLVRIEKKLDRLAQTPVPVELPDRMSFEEAREFINMSSSALYKMTHAGKIPHGNFGGRKGRLIFSRKELTAWLEENTHKSDTDKQVTDALAKAVRRKK